MACRSHQKIECTICNKKLLPYRLTFHNNKYHTEIFKQMPNSITDPKLLLRCTKNVEEKILADDMKYYHNHNVYKIAANRFKNIRATLCTSTIHAEMARKHNDSNILIMGGRVVGQGLAKEIVKTWLNTEFEGGRHQKRLDKISQLDDYKKL